MGSGTLPLRVLFFPLMAPGHMLPMIDIAKLFASRGVKATVLTTPANAPAIEAAIDLVNSSYQYPIQLHLIPFPSAAVGLPEGCENFSTASPAQHLSLFAGVTMLQEPFRRALAELLPDAVLTDWFLPWTYVVAEELNIPRLVFHGVSAFSLCAYESFLGKPLPPSDEETIVIPNFPRHVELLRSQVPKFQKADPLFNEMLDQVTKWEPLSYGVVVNSFYELEREFADHLRDVIGRKTWHVGPVSLCNKQAEEVRKRGNSRSTMDVERWLGEKEEDSVLYVCFGSLSSFTKAQFVEIALGLEACGHPFIWVVREWGDDWLLPEGYVERMEGRRCMILKNWAPQILILNHTAVGGFVTHCGWNSSLEGVSSGVPMVTWPLFGDQFFNERLITEVLRIGVPVGAKQSTVIPDERPLITAAEIESAVRQVMDDGEVAKIMRRRAKDISLLAKRATEEGGSSHNDLERLIQELTDRQSNAKAK